MTDDEIRKRLSEFVDEILYTYLTPQDARELEKRLDAFCEENNVTFEQQQLIAESGAGETLRMLTTMTD